MTSASGYFDETVLAGTSRSKVKALSAYDNSQHSVPKIHDDRSSFFISKLAEADITNDVESTFQKLRKAFKFKRKEIKVLTPEPGWGLIETRYFDYAIYATLDPEDLSSVLWDRSVRQIRSFDQIGSEAFAAIFDLVFNRIEKSFQTPIEIDDWIDNIEDLDDERIQLDYDSGLSHCRLRMDGIAPEIEVTATQFSVVHPSPAKVADIVASYLEIHDAVQSGLADR